MYPRFSLKFLRRKISQILFSMTKLIGCPEQLFHFNRKQWKYKTSEIQFVKRKLQTKYVPNIILLGPYIKELKCFEDSSPYQNSSFQEGPKFSSSIKCRFSPD